MFLSVYLLFFLCVTPHKALPYTFVYRNTQSPILEAMREMHSLPHIVLEPKVCKHVEFIDWVRYESLLLKRREFLSQLQSQSQKYEQIVLVSEIQKTSFIQVLLASYDLLLEWYTTTTIIIILHCSLVLVLVLPLLTKKVPKLCVLKLKYLKIYFNINN